MGLRGLLPPVNRTMDPQEAIVLAELCQPWAERQDDMIETKGSGVTREDVRRRELLTGLHERNETLYYKIIMDNFTDLSRIIYTPTVGWACARSVCRSITGMFCSSRQLTQILWDLQESSWYVLFGGRQGRVC